MDVVMERRFTETQQHVMSVELHQLMADTEACAPDVLTRQTQFFMSKGRHIFHNNYSVPSNGVTCNDF